MFFEPCNCETWQMTLKNNREPLPYHFKLCASFCSNWWIQTGVTVQKHPIWVKIDNFFLAVWPQNLSDNLEKQQGSSYMQHQALRIISSPYVNSNFTVTVWKRLCWVLTSVTLTFGLWLWPFVWTSLRSLAITLKLWKLKSSWWCYDGIIVKNSHMRMADPAAAKTRKALNQNHKKRGEIVVIIRPRTHVV